MDSNSFTILMENKTIRRQQQGHLIKLCIEREDLRSLILHKMALENEHSHYYARVLEMAVKQDLSIIFNHLNVFGDNLSKISSDGCCRSSAKICELLMVAYQIKKDFKVQVHLRPKQQEQIITTCFDWKITNRAIAIQAHSMYALYLLGFEHPWIHPDLSLLIEKNIPHGSTGYKNRGRKIIKAIQTKKLFKL